MQDKYKQLEEFVQPFGYTVDNVSQGYTWYITFRHILKNYELQVDINNKTFDIDLHNSRYTYGMALELIGDLHFMKVLANYTLELFKDANKPCGKFTKCNNAEGCDNCAEFDTWLKESEGKK